MRQEPSIGVAGVARLSDRHAIRVPRPTANYGYGRNATADKDSYRERSYVPSFPAQRAVSMMARGKTT